MKILKPMKYVLAIAAASIFAYQPVQAKELIVGVNVGNVPWEFQDKSGEIIGFEVDLAKEVGKRLNSDIRLINIPFNGLFSAVQSGRIDMAASSITITKERLQSVSFAQPYYDSDQSLSVRKDSGVTGLAGLKGKIVGVDTGSTGDIWASAHSKEYGISEIRRYEGLVPAMLDLMSKRIDGYISDIPSVQYYIKDKPNLTVAERIPTGEKYSFMFKKNSPLATEVNEVITTLKKDGYLSKLHEKWYGVLPDAGSSTSTVLPMPE